MRGYARSLVLGVAGLVLGAWLLAPSTRSTAADGGKEVREAILKIAASLEKGDKDGAKKEAAALAKKMQGKKPEVEMEELMHMFQLRSKKGLGAGTKAGAIMPDGIEKKIEILAEKAIPAKQLDDEAKGLEEMGYHLAAIGEIAALAVPIEKDMGKKKVKDWVKWSEDMKAAGVDLAAGAKGKKADAIKTAADKANTSCTKCHDVFRYDN
ncbi:MAG: cytochrome c [Gemmataceae bacterium]|nr:cytochrome c [Gemmataceae bacterium]